MQTPGARATRKLTGATLTRQRSRRRSEGSALWHRKLPECLPRGRLHGAAAAGFREKSSNCTEGRGKSVATVNFVQRFLRSLATLIMVINTLLMLAAALTFRYERQGSGRWSPTPPPPAVDPFGTYQQFFRPLA